MRHATIVLASLVSLALLASLPLIPSAFLFRFTPLAYHSSANHSSLKADEVSDALAPVLRHEKYGTTAGLPRFLGAYEYLRVYRIGILSVQDASTADRQRRCATCTVVVDTGFACGMLCGGGATFYLALVNGQWRIETYSLWVS